MKAFLRITLLLLVLVAPIFAGNARIPGGGPVKLLVTLPDDWKSELDEDGELSAESPNEELGLACWAVPVSEMADFKNLTANIGKILDECVTKLTLACMPRNGQIGKVRTVLFDGTGLDADDNQPVKFRALILFAGPEDVTVLYVAAGSQAGPGKSAVLDQIVRSVRPE